MRVLIATSNRAVVGGVETYLRHVIPAMGRRSHAIALLTEQPSPPETATIDQDSEGLRQWDLSADGSGALRAAQAWKPDVCYLQGLQNPETEAALVERFPTVLFAHTYHGTCVSGTKRFGWPNPRPCGRVFGATCLALYYPCRCGGLNPRTMLRQYGIQKRRSDLLLSYRAVLVVSRHMRDEYRRHGLTDDRLHLVPYFPPGQDPDPEPPTARPGWGCVLFVGRLTNLKGVRLLVDAVAGAEQALGRTLSLTVAGDGPERPALERAARQCGVRAEFLGWVGTAERIELMRRSDVLAVPSVWPEPFGLVGLEAGCVGLPAVAFAVGGIPDWLWPGESGELATGDPPTVSGLAAALVRALSDPVYLQRLRHGAWKMAQRFSCERHLDLLENVLQRVVQG
jgi:glycosyltransferase involved in cell wall biosynthesis